MWWQRKIISYGLFCAQISLVMVLVTAAQTPLSAEVPKTQTQSEEKARQLWEQSLVAKGGRTKLQSADVRTLFCIYLITRVLARQLDEI